MSESIISARSGRVGHIQLDRPKALNALTVDMIEAIDSALVEWSDAGAVDSVLVTSTSPKAFCAGGDIKAVRDAVISGDTSDGRRFFEVEYAMNARIANFPVPYASLLFGATMGGGIGVSAHGSHRIVTETLMSSMPETAIGFIPDVGASWLLPRFAGGGDIGLAIAKYLGTTGARMNAADALYLGLGTHFIYDAVRPDFQATVLESGLDQALDEHCSDPGEAGTSTVRAQLEYIVQAFSGDTIEEILGTLDSMTTGPAEAADWATSTREALQSHSPTSVVATLELMKAGAQVSSVEQALDNELNLGALVCQGPDFPEGVRAVLVDKSRDAAWQPAAFADVDIQAIRDTLSTD